MHRLAQHVLSREDPQESFLKSVPGDAVSVDIIYPVSSPRMVFLCFNSAGACWSGPRLAGRHSSCRGLRAAWLQSRWDERLVRRRMRHMLQREGMLYTRRKVLTLFHRVLRLSCSSSLHELCVLAASATAL